MSVDRYLAVVHPICSLTIRTARNAAILLGIVWFIIVLANAPLFSDFTVRQESFNVSAP
jgi:7 transmembrane receptor (rhodopsin family)